MQIIDHTDIIEINEPNKLTQEDTIIVGIDFGTTNSLIAISKNHKAETIEMPNGNCLLPSIININNGNIIIGNNEAANNEATSNNSIHSIKRLLAKSASEIANDPKLQILTDLSISGSTIPKININGKEITITEIASEIFKYLKLQAENILHCSLEKAVISIPAYFNNTARGQILLAAKLAGFEVMRLIAEPTAAAYAYGLNNKSEGSYLVYDLGGGTFDVSILNMQKGILQVIATGGDTMLGGDDIDMIIAEYLAKSSNIKITKKLLKIAKKLKEELSHKTEATIDSFTITKQKYEEIIDPIINKTIKIAKSTLHDADNIELDGIILVGGSTRIPLIASKLAEKFSTNIFSNLDPDKIVALGAAMQAENLSSKSNSLLIDVIPLSIGLELHGGLVEKLILRNTPIPFSTTKQFTTHVDDQTGIKFHILQGERERVQDCKSLAYFELNNIPAMKAGKAKVEVKFALDADGILSVTARETTSGLAHNIEIKPSYDLNEEKINKELNDAFRNSAWDHDIKLLMETRESAKSLIFGIKKAISETPDLLSEKDNTQLKNAINSLQKLLNSDNRNKILSEMNLLNKLAENFIQKHLDKGLQLHIKGRNINDIN